MDNSLLWWIYGYQKWKQKKLANMIATDIFSTEPYLVKQEISLRFAKLWVPDNKFFLENM